MSTPIPDLPATQTAIITQSDTKLGISHNVAVPDLEPTMVLIKNVAVPLNPTDYKMPANFPSPGAINGSDFTGTIIAMGSAVKRPLKVGNRVCGAVHGANPIRHQSGTFAEYVEADPDFIIKVPDDMAWEAAAAIGGAVIGTVGLGLFHSLGLPGPEKPAKKAFVVLVYGGSTACGTMAIQLLKLSGLTPITTCSPKNFALVKSYGAEKAFDYRSPTCAADIRSYTKNSLEYVIDTVAEAETMQLCYTAIGRAGGKYTALEMYPESLATRKTVKPDFVMGITMLGKRIALDRGYAREPDPEMREFGEKWFRQVQKMVDEGKIKSHPVRVMGGGFAGILKGLDLLRSRTVSGEKLVYRISQTNE